MVHKRIFTFIPLIILVMSLFAGQVQAAPANSLNNTNVQAALGSALYVFSRRSF